MHQKGIWKYSIKTSRFLRRSTATTIDLYDDRPFLLSPYEKKKTSPFLATAIDWYSHASIGQPLQLAVVPSAAEASREGVAPRHRLRHTHTHYQFYSYCLWIEPGLRHRLRLLRPERFHISFSDLCFPFLSLWFSFTPLLPRKKVFLCRQTYTTVHPKCFPRDYFQHLPDN